MKVVKILIVNAKLAIVLASAIFFAYGWFPNLSLLPIVGMILLPFGLLIAFISVVISLRERFKSSALSESRKLAKHSLVLHGFSILLFLLYAFIGFVDFDKQLNGTREKSFSLFAFRVAEATTLGDSGGPPVSIVIGYGFIPFTSLMSSLNTEVFEGNCYGVSAMEWSGINQLSIVATSCPEKGRYVERVGSVVVTIVKE